MNNCTSRLHNIKQQALHVLVTMATGRAAGGSSGDAKSAAAASVWSSLIYFLCIFMAIMAKFHVTETAGLIKALH